MSVYKFRNCLLNTVERLVIKDNQCVELTTKTFDVLLFLIENAGNIVSKDEILGTVWNGDFVEESNLPVHISKLRRSLEETRERRFIETIQGVGYRFIAPVRHLPDKEWEQIVNQNRQLNGEALPAPPIQSIAVLPLENKTGDVSNEYLSDGLTEELINSLSHIPGLRVIARNTVFHFKNNGPDCVEVGRALSVSSVVTGRIRFGNGCLEVGVELVRSDNGAQIWGRVFRGRGAELVALQEEISFALAEQLALAKGGLNSSLSVPSLTRDPESYRLYLNGRYLLEKHSAQDLYRAIEFFEKSALQDSNNTFSLVEIVDCYRLLYAYDHITYKEFLIAIEPILARIRKGDQSLDVIQVMYCDLNILEWKFAEAAQFCRKALAINPNCLKGRLRYSELLMQSRNFGAALEQLERIIALDPLSSLIYTRIGRLFYIMGEQENAVAYLTDALHLVSDNHEARAVRGMVYIEMERYKEALDDFEASLQVERQNGLLGMMAVVHVRQGNRKKACQLLKKVKSEPIGAPGRSITLAHIYLALGEKEKTYEFLEHAYTEHEPDLRGLTFDRRWKTLGAEARFKDLASRIGLPALSD